MGINYWRKWVGVWRGVLKWHEMGDSQELSVVGG